MSAHLRLADLLGGLSTAADLGFGLPPEEAMRSCLVATALARDLDLSDAAVSDTFYTALLMHVGCSALSHETAAVWGDDRVVMRTAARTNVADPDDIASKLLPAITQGMEAARRAEVERFAASADGRAFGRTFDTGSCEVASATARRIGLGAGVERALREAVEWWNGEGPPSGLGGDDIALPARIARIAADAARFDDLGGPDAAVAALRRRAGVILDPDLVARFTARAEVLLAPAHAGDPRELILDAEPAPPFLVEVADVPRIAGAFGDLADLKTPWTHGHSGAVARLATTAGARVGLDRQTVFRLGVSAALADLGRLAVSNAIWEKPGPLTRTEHEQVRMYPYHSERILATSRTLEPMARTAGMHHERLDGSGYHRGCRARELPADVRVLAAADVLQALLEPRPHRAALGLDAAAEELKREVRALRLDGEAAAAVLEAAGARRPGPRENVRPAGLSEREVEVLRLVAAGCSNAAIAERLVVSRRTAEHHVQHIYAKVGVASRAALALFAHEHDLVG